MKQKVILAIANQGDFDNVIKGAIKAQFPGEKIRIKLINETVVFAEDNGLAELIKKTPVETAVVANRTDFSPLSLDEAENTGRLFWIITKNDCNCSALMEKINAPYQTGIPACC